VSPRSVFRYLTWRLRPEDAENTEPVIHQFFCNHCDGCGPADEDFEAARGWIFAHLATTPEHTGYREEITRYWRADLVDGQAPQPLDPAPATAPAVTASRGG
jgi:hypothetical protein